MKRCPEGIWESDGQKTAMKNGAGRGSAGRDEGPTLYLLCGLSFAGKSTLARQLAGPLGAEIVEADTYIPLVEAELPNVGKLESWRAIQTRARAAVREALERGRSVIYDDLLVKPDVRAALEELAKASGAEVRTIYLETPPETIRERQHRASDDPERRAQWEAHTNLLIAQLVPPDPKTAVYVAPTDTLPQILTAIQSVLMVK